MTDKNSATLNLVCMRCGEKCAFFGTKQEAWGAAVAIGWRITRLLSAKCEKCAGKLTAYEAFDWTLCRGRDVFRWIFMTIAPIGAFYGFYLFAREMIAYVLS